MAALIGTTVVSLLTFLTSVVGPNAYNYLLAASGLTGFIVWVGIAISHYRFQRAMVAQGVDLGILKYRAKWFPFGPLFALVICILVIIGQNPQSFIHFNLQEVLITYIDIPLIIVLYLGYKFYYKTKLIPLKDVDLSRDDVEKTLNN